MHSTTLVSAKLDEQKLDHHFVKRYYHDWIDRLLPIALERGTGSPEWQAEVDAAAPRLHDETLARSMASLAAGTFNLWSKHIPSKLMGTA